MLLVERMVGVKIITENETEFERLAQGLLEYETLTGDEIKRVMNGDAPTSGPDEDDTPDQGSAPSDSHPEDQTAGQALGRDGT